MRLDHLLSKERLPRESGVRGPPAADVGGGCSFGGDTGEVGAGNGHRPSTAFGFLLCWGGGSGVWNGWVVRLVAVFGASCWVLREQALVGLFLGAWSCRRDCPRVGVCRCGWVGWSLFENCTVDASIFWRHAPVGVCCLLITDCFGQVAEGGWWMPWHQEPMKDVGGRDSPGGAVNQASIPGFPNGVTRHQSCGVTRT